VSVLLRLAVLWWLLAPSLPLSAETVRLAMPGNLTGIAEYHRGEPDKAAVLILHGFLATHNFNTVLNLAEALRDEGYTVLTPTLTLGINARRESLPCDAIHTHTLYRDIAEIDRWVVWLTHQTRQPIVLVGHSYGSLELLAWLARHHRPQVRQLITISLSYADNFNPPAVAKRQIREARQAMNRGEDSPHRFTLSYCRNNFVAPPHVYLSYMAWPEHRVIAALKAASIPVEVIMGGADRRFDGHWFKALKATGARLKIIPGASHFFDTGHEFDLHDTILERLERLP